jgi:hypothetical protein
MSEESTDTELRRLVASARPKQVCSYASSARHLWHSREPTSRESKIESYQWCATSITNLDPAPGPCSTNTRNGNLARTASPMVDCPS